MRNVSSPLRWLGLSLDDRDRLKRWLDELGVAPTELHTHVGVGCIPEPPPEADTPELRRVLYGRWPWRIDAAVCFGRSWWLIECKECVTHFMLGQIACYWYWWRRDVGHLRLRRAVAVVDYCDPEMAELARLFGVDVCCV